jgi:putative acetyltransferase
MSAASHRPGRSTSGAHPDSDPDRRRASGRGSGAALVVRPEGSADRAAVRRVIERAFGPDGGEADLVDALREAGADVPDLCLVAEIDGQIVGQIFYSRARLASGDEVLALAPMAVLPSYQRRGVGSRLVSESLRRARETDFPLVVVLGHPEYYPRFGFEPAGARGVDAPWDVPAEAWMLLPLPAYHPTARGLVEYPPAFGAVA